MGALALAFHINCGLGDDTAMAANPALNRPADSIVARRYGRRLTLRAPCAEARPRAAQLCKPGKAFQPPDTSFQLGVRLLA
jgi:hypothetical protein